MSSSSSVGKLLLPLVRLCLLAVLTTAIGKADFCCSGVRSLCPPRGLGGRRSCPLDDGGRRDRRPILHK